MSNAPAKRKYRRRIFNPSRHGHYGTPTYRVWVNLISRCENPDNPNYPRYGGRGITVCDRWRLSFTAFLEDMGEKPSDMSIDRINNDLGYFASNCRWATQSQQCRNQSRTLFLTHEGETLSLRDWCDRLDIRFWPAERKLREGLHSSLVLNPRYRLPRRKPGRNKGSRFLTADGRTQSLSDWSREKELLKETIRQRIISGWTEEEAVMLPVGTVPERLRYQPSKRTERPRGNPGRPKKLYEHDGELKSLDEWAFALGMTTQALRSRLKGGQTLAEAIARPRYAHRSTKDTEVIRFRGDSRTVAEWADALGLLPCSLRVRLKKQPLEVALTKPRYVHTSKLKSPT